METVPIRFARPDDVPALSAVERAAATRFRHSALGAAAALATTLPAEVLAEAQREGRLWVATGDGGAPIGFALASAWDGVAHLEELSVVPEAGRRGIGSALLDTVVAWAAARGCRAVTLSTFRDVPWNAPFYARRGFRALDDAALGPALEAVRAHERAAGLPVQERTLMRRDLGPTRIVFYDGGCGLCSRLVQRLLAADRRGLLRFAPLQGRTAAALRLAHPEIPADVDSVLFLERRAEGGERVSWRSGAILAIADALGGRWRLLGVLRILPTRLADAAYDAVARSRHRWFGPPACALPGPAAWRFLP